MQPEDGSDKNGLICGFVFCGDAPGATTDLEAALAWLAGNEDGCVWLHFNLADAAAEGWIREHLPIVPDSLEALHEGSRSTRIEAASDTLVAVINDVAFEFAFDPSEIETLWVQVGPRVALSAPAAAAALDRQAGSGRQGWPPLRFFGAFSEPSVARPG